MSQDQLIGVSVSTLSDRGLDVSEVGPNKSSASGPKRPWRGVGISVILVGVVVGLGWVVIQGAMPGDSGQMEAILRVLTEDDGISKETMGSLSTDDTPSVYAEAIGRYLIQVQAVDTSDCPADFRVAFKRHLDCWIDLRTALKAMPDDFLQGFFVGFMNGYFFGEKDGGMNRMTGNVRQAALEIRTSFREVEEIAAKYGAALP